jgi:hypothetical protein
VDAMERKGLESALRLSPQQGLATGPGEGDLAAADDDMARSSSGGRRLNDLGSERERGRAERFGGERIVLCGDRGATASSTEEGRPATLGTDRWGFWDQSMAAPVCPLGSLNRPLPPARSS